MISDRLFKLEKQAAVAGLILRIQIRRPFGLWAIKLVVAQKISPKTVQIWGEMKGWAYGRSRGLQLDTMRVHPDAPIGVGALIWAATMAWTLEETPCMGARLLAILDDEQQHKRLTRYFLWRGFKVAKEVNASLIDLPLRMIWGGAGSLMIADCEEVYKRNYRLWEKAFVTSYQP